MKKNHDAKTRPRAKLFMCVGGVETSVSGFEKLTSFLNNRHYSNLEIESKVLENIGHSGTKGGGYEKGLQFVFKRPSLKLSSDLLQQYKGSYKLNDGMVIQIKPGNGSLVALAENDEFKLLAASETEFYLTSSFLKIHFMKDQKGDVSGFQGLMFL